MKNNFENGSFIAKCKNDMDVFPLSNSMNTEFRSIFFWQFKNVKQRMKMKKSKMRISLSFIMKAMTIN